jgi:hypothetical protein
MRAVKTFMVGRSKPTWCGGNRRCGERKGKGELLERDHGGGGSLSPAISIASLFHRVASRRISFEIWSRGLLP